MSRVDEALRRAAGQVKGEVVETIPAMTVVSDMESDVASLSRTAFPLEMPQTRRARPAATPPEIPAPSPAGAVVAPSFPESRTLLERIDSRLAQKVVVDDRVNPASREQYRRLAAALHHAQAANGTKVVMIASAVPGEGKTLTASNLALTFSESYQRSVLLIDGDLRKPGLHLVFGLDNAAGLGEGLVSAEETKLRVQQVTPRLSILSAGMPSPDPMAGLTSDRMRRVLEEAREAFDWVFIDTPPVAFLSDANLLARMVDAAVLVVKAGSTPFELVQRATEAIGRDKAIGVVLNRADPGDISSGYGYGYGYYGAYSRTGNLDDRA
jgi:capsular exopolysaccharide synthesis family protein